MSAIELRQEALAKVWGRRDLPDRLRGSNSSDEPVGEIVFHDQASGGALLAKYIFTSERLSIQVHPDDEAAKARGWSRGKDEAWVVIDAAPGATIGIGLLRSVSRDELRSAALDGSIVDLMDWRPVTAGDCFYVAAGTVHAIGGGVSLIEVQQNLDVTYRLFDYGRPRELQLEDALAVAHAGPAPPASPPLGVGDGRSILATGRAFTIERLNREGEGLLGRPGEGPLWIVPLEGQVRIDGRAAEIPAVWLADAECDFALDDDSAALIAYEGPPRQTLWGAS
jgi:mannose-6-phosphate isomerase